MIIDRYILEKAVDALVRSNEFLFRRICDRWITDATFVEAIKRLDVIDASMNFDVKSLNNSIGRHSSWKLQIKHYENQINTCGIHQEKFGAGAGQKFYYLRSEGKRINKPNICRSWRDGILSQQESIVNSLDERPAATRRSLARQREATTGLESSESPPKSPRRSASTETPTTAIGNSRSDATRDKQTAVTPDDPQVGSGGSRMPSWSASIETPTTIGFAVNLVLRQATLPNSTANSLEKESNTVGVAQKESIGELPWKRRRGWTIWSRQAAEAAVDTRRR